ncbi:unnamed protein product, partial [Closterium sp. NIES-54]
MDFLSNEAQREEKQSLLPILADEKLGDGSMTRRVSFESIQNATSFESIQNPLRADEKVEGSMTRRGMSFEADEAPQKQNLLPLRADEKLDGSMTRRGMLAAVSYMICAVTLVMFNKAALSSFNFPCANAISLLQMLSSTALLAVLRLAGVLTFASASATPDVASSTFVPLQTLGRVLPLSLSYMLNVVISMASIRGVNVPMYTALRRTTVAFTLIAERLLASKQHSAYTLVSVAVIVAGALLAAVRDFSFEAYGYSIVLLSNITTALYLTLIARLGKSTGLNSFGLMWSNGINCIPALLLWTFLSGEIQRALAFPALLDPAFLVVLSMSCLMAFALNYTVFLNTSLNSALTQNMCGNLKDLGTVGIGWALFGGLPFDV